MEHKILSADEHFKRLQDKFVLKYILELNLDCPRHNGHNFDLESTWPSFGWRPCYCEEQGFIPSVDGYIT